AAWGLFWGEVEGVFAAAGFSGDGISAAGVGGGAGGSVWRDPGLWGNCGGDRVSEGGAGGGGGGWAEAVGECGALPAGGRGGGEWGWGGGGGGREGWGVWGGGGGGGGVRALGGWTGWDEMGLRWGFFVKGIGWGVGGSWFFFVLLLRGGGVRWHSC